MLILVRELVVQPSAGARYSAPAPLELPRACYNWPRAEVGSQLGRVCGP